MKEKKDCLYMIPLFIFVAGCMAHYSPVKKELFSKLIARNQVEILRGAILSEGYDAIRESYPYEGAIVYDYAKGISISGIKSRVQIHFSYKDADALNGYYRNLGISVLNLDFKDVPEVNAEIDRMEGVLYEKLLEVAGAENVKRGEEIYRRPKINWIPWRNKKSNITDTSAN